MVEQTEPKPDTYGIVKTEHFLEALNAAPACLLNDVLMDIIADGTGRLVSMRDAFVIVMSKDTVSSVKAIRCKTDFKRGGFSVRMVGGVHYTVLPLHIALVYDLIPPPQ
jgi:hypothetical protein